jgi:hypothetical protein
MDAAMRGMERGTRVKFLFLLLPKKRDEERHPRKINPAPAGQLKIARYVSKGALAR